MKYFLGVFVLAALFLAGCQSFDDLSSNVQERFQALEQKGLPDSLITPIRMAFTTAQLDRNRNRNDNAMRNMNVALEAVERAEKYLENSLSELKPRVVARRNALAARAESDFRGLQKFDADSIVAVIDSFLSIDFVFRAQSVVQKFEDNYAKMVSAQATADSVRPRIVGTWVYLDTAKHAFDRNVNAIERRTFILNRDGTGRFISEKRGQSAPNLREEWRFETRGNWDLRGNVIYLAATRWTGSEQKFWQLNENTGQWGFMNHETNQFVNNQPSIVAADVLESDHPDIGRQSLFVSFDDLQRDFRRQR
ncbi:MAG: hypothetical protein FWE23_07185 [Chitinivibrionia bacterium]|jgi:outer membrane murein-binding lipoprotein Lpp|nr:hypothetical protein [Chitinivibrionia bacterium]